MSDQKITPEDTDTGSEKSAHAPVADTAPQQERSAEQTDRISARAHSKSQERTSGAAGDSQTDWLEAEREIDSATKGDQR